MRRILVFSSNEIDGNAIRRLLSEFHTGTVPECKPPNDYKSKTGYDMVVIDTTQLERPAGAFLRCNSHESINVEEFDVDDEGKDLSAHTPWIGFVAHQA